MRVISADWDPWGTEPAPEPLDPADLTDRDILLLVRKDAEREPIPMDRETLLAAVDERLAQLEAPLRYTVTDNPDLFRTIELTSYERRLLGH